MQRPLALTASYGLLGKTRSRAREIVRDAVLVAAGALLVGAAARISIPLPFTPVPITGQTFAVLLVGASLGSARGVVSLALYVAVGVLGLPFFAGGAHGASVVAGASGGYLLSYPLVGLVVGRLAERGWDRRFSSAVGAMLTGNVLIYLVGIPWLAHAMHAPVLSQRVLLAGLYPFIPGDTLKLYLAAAALPVTWRFVGRGDDAEFDVR